MNLPALRHFHRSGLAVWVAGRRRAAALPALGFALSLALGCGAARSTGVAPTITSFSPSSGPYNTLVTVNGSGYSNGVNGVSIGGVTVPSSDGAVVSDSQLQFTIPSAAITGVIAVATPAGTATTATEFIVAPSITGLSTSTGSASAGTPVTVSGYGLDGITGITVGNVASQLTTQNANTIVFPVPATAPQGAITLTFVVNPNYGIQNLLAPFTVTP